MVIGSRVWLEKIFFLATKIKLLTNSLIKLAKCETLCLAGLNAILSDCRRVKAVKIHLAEKTLRKIFVLCIAPDII